MKHYLLQDESDGAGDESQTIPEVTKGSPYQETTERNIFPTKYSSRIKQFGKTKRLNNPENNYSEYSNESPRYRQRIRDDLTDTPDVFHQVSEE